MCIWCAKHCCISFLRVRNRSSLFLKGRTLRIVVASPIAFFASECVNSFVLPKNANPHERQTSVAPHVGAWDNFLLYSVMFGNYILKLLREVLATPHTGKIVAWLKRGEREDYYDRGIHFTPFSLET